MSVSRQITERNLRASHARREEEREKLRKEREGQEVEESRPAVVVRRLLERLGR